MFFGFDLYLLSLATLYICFLCSIVTLKHGYAHIPIHLDRGLVFLGFSWRYQGGCQVAWLAYKDFACSLSAQKVGLFFVSKVTALLLHY